MSFLHPEYFYYLMPFLFIVLGLFLVKKEAQEEFFSKEVMDKLRVSVNTLSLKTRNKLFFLISVLIIIALAEPVIKDGVIEIKSKSADIMIALDISDSMLAEDVYPNRLKFAKQKAIDLLKLAPRERVGVIAFAKNSYLVSPVSFDHDAVRFLLSKLSTDSITEKGTDFIALLNVVNKTVKKEEKKHLLILSDGGDKDDFSDEIEFAKENNIIIYVLGIGTEKGAPIKNKDGSFIKYKGKIIVSRLNENIASLATSSAGVYIQSVKSDEDIKAMMREINRTSNKKELQVQEVQKFIPLFYYPLYLAVFILLIATSSLARKSSTLGALIISILLITPDTNAELLDFLDLREAKEAYEAGDYEKSAKIYAKHAEDTNNSKSFYNYGNSLYKQENFDAAIKSYNKAKFDDNRSKANTLANIGNSYVKQAKEKSLEEALKAYKESLKYKEDKEVRENLEAVKKELKKQKSKQKKDDKSQDEKDKKENKDKEENKDSQESDKSDKNSDKEKDSKDKKQNSDKKDDEKSDKEEEKQKNKKKDDLNKLDASDEKAQASQSEKKGEMSDEEQMKWLNKLNSEQNTFMYMLNEHDKSNEENPNEKPW